MKMSTCKVTVPYISVWDGGIEIETAAVVDLRTGEITDIRAVDVNGLDTCEREYIVMNDEQVNILYDVNGFDYSVELNNRQSSYIGLTRNLRKDTRLFVESVLTEYHSSMPESFYNDIIADVMECSAYSEGYYSQGDISLAFQRTVAKQFNLEI